jgi:Holliday junction resolvase RusA-like endonuclease
MDKILLVINLEPMAAPRPRAVSIHGRTRSYMPKKYTVWKSQAIQQVKAQYAGQPIDQQVHVEITSIHERPKRLFRKKDSINRIYKPTKPDIDNIAKSVLDVLQDASVIKNDAIVVGLSVFKYYGAIENNESENPSLVIEVSLVPPMSINL